LCHGGLGAIYLSLRGICRRHCGIELLTRDLIFCNQSLVPLEIFGGAIAIRNCGAKVGLRRYSASARILNVFIRSGYAGYRFDFRALSGVKVLAVEDEAIGI
jgi:hypothetical protein